VYLKFLIRMLCDGSVLSQYAKLSLLQLDTEHVVDKYTPCPEPRKLSVMWRLPIPTTPYNDRTGVSKRVIRIGSFGKMQPRSCNGFVHNAARLNA